MLATAKPTLSLAPSSLLSPAQTLPMSAEPHPSSRTLQSYVKHIDASYSVRIIVQSVAEERRLMGHGAWNVGLLSSPFKSGGAGWVRTCLVPWACPCISIAQAAARIGIWPYAKAFIVFFILHMIRIVCVITIASEYDHESLGSTSFIVALGLLVVSSLVVGIAVFTLRRRVRATFVIPGSSCSDFVASCCCYCCVLGQLVSHVQTPQADEGQLDRSPDTLAGYDAVQ